MSSTESIPQERWVPVPGYEGVYEVSDQGRVRSLDWTIVEARRVRHKRGRVLTPWIDKIGRPCVHLRGGHNDHFGAKPRVSQIVLVAFIGNPPPGHVGCHNDGDPANNTPSNLRWDTQSANMLDRRAHGTDHYANRTHCSHGHPLTPENLYIQPSPEAVAPNRTRRRCRTCTAAVGKRYRQSLVKSGAVALMALALLVVALPVPAKASPATNAYAAKNGEAICSVLDSFPNANGIMGIADALVAKGFTYYEAGEIEGTAVLTFCPRHTALLQRFITQGEAPAAPVGTGLHRV